MKHILLPIGTKHVLIAGMLLLICTIVLSTTANATLSSITSNFNGTNIADTSYIWFNSHLTSVSGGSGVIEVYMMNQRIELTGSLGSYVLPVPDALVTIDSATATATTTWMTSSGGWWSTEVASAANNPFLAGYTWDLPTGENPAGANPVTWYADFYSNQAGVVSIQWQWAAAVYTSFSTDYSTLGVTPIDGNYGGKSYQSGTPLTYIAYVTGGARGGGGSNYTGSNSGTGTAADLDLIPLPGAVLVGVLGLGVAGWRLRKYC